MKCKFERCNKESKSKGLCSSHYQKMHTTSEYRRNYRENKIKTYQDLLGGKCLICGDTSNLEFDHINRNRGFCIGNGWGKPEEVVLEELKKCQLLCHKCHMKKTIKEKGWKVLSHGSYSMYTNGHCRCDKCKAAWAIYKITYRLKHKLVV